MDPTLKNVLLVVTTLGVFAFVGLILAAVFVFGPGQVFVLPPGGGTVTVAVDGGAPVTVSGRYQKVNVPQGQHALDLTTADGKTTRVNVDVPSGFANLAVAPSGMCFAEIDVTDSHYSGSHAPPTVLSTFRGEEGHVLTSVPAFSEDDLPKSINQSSRQTLLVDLPCDDVGGSQGDVLAATGLWGR